MTKFFATYTGLEVLPHTAETSDDGHSAQRSAMHITRTPAFMERVLVLQQDFNMQQTGTVYRRYTLHLAVARMLLLRFNT